MKLTTYSSIFGALVTLALASCSPETSSPSSTSTLTSPSNLKPVQIDQNQFLRGQTLYIPIYSHVYHQNNLNNELSLSAMLSVRNTDFNHPIVITTVDYYNDSGALVRQELEQPVELGPMASTQFFLASTDRTGGAGANFIVKWAATEAVTNPIIEAVMVSTTSSQGISFLSPGQVLAEFGPKGRN